MPFLVNSLKGLIVFLKDFGDQFQEFRPPLGKDLLANGSRAVVFAPPTIDHFVS